MQGNGYIHSSKKTSETGVISFCNGAGAGNDVDFAFADCEDALQQKLRQKDVTGIPKGQCSSLPPRAILVGFDIGAHGEAINIVEL